MGRIVVGMDASQESVRALAWAAARTERFGPVQVVSAWRYPWWALAPQSFGAPVHAGEDEVHAATQRHVDEMIETEAPCIERLQTLTVHGAAGPALVNASSGANLLVVGTRGRGALAGGVLGSVSSHCVHHASVPVVVVPADAPAGPIFDRVVVGVDGSDASVVALVWAIRNSEPSTSIEAVHAWDLGPAALDEIGVVAVEELEVLAAEMAAKTVARAAEQSGQPDRDVAVMAHQGDARSLLRLASADADLLVVGAQGHHGFAHLLLGSVATALVHHPAVPTVVVR